MGCFVRERYHDVFSYIHRSFIEHWHDERIAMDGGDHKSNRRSGTAGRIGVNQDLEFFRKDVVVVGGQDDVQCFRFLS
jgi:hypothetical protein